MFRRDYIVRMIEDMTAMVAKVLTLKQERKTTEALWEVDELLNRHFRLNSRLLNSLSAEDIVEMFRLGGIIESDKLQGVARLLKEEGGIYAAAGDKEAALFRYMRSLHLFLRADLHGADRELLNMNREMEELLQETEGYQLPVKTERLLLSYLESAGSYAKAEDSLYRLWEQGVDVAAEGHGLYGRLLQKSPEALELGGLPLEEVQQGLAEWERITAAAKQEQR
ncbi:MULTISPECIES: DUF6483 family protein [unclassified Paenibacillus]|uniref:DUF6483 family protein n=1 Tax=unclassified Paenibacillus TaxID=185978 RepID=UPI0024076281|nr:MULTISPECIES: DUF6483 family protein [unclassified Paenibacillus]MDF9843042.1 hypothetical protein [Paenibacillus sp. PastF-2]MDF9849746.1 hypothetical protein [Paenibacillus sp. PastM-2]MDF9856337.1 hypothetical protein [Paenibacillus sp. PastF-1]MDH6481608.1 hypothetical protein [Paenibacillus sp. PastH-2]MDH6508890.1 hypothetical protein [Paenibacillus sp. PastM-3]